METRIQEQLNRIEQERGVRILYAVESGSRAWGFASEDSDFDVRFVFIRPLQDYVRIRPLRDVIELPIKDDLDINGWDIVKALNLFRASNPPLMEWLYSPIVYRETSEFAGQLRSLASTFWSQRRMTYHYLSMARTQFRMYIEGQSELSLKKYLYVLRPLLAIQWMEAHRTPPPTQTERVLEGLSLDTIVRDRIDALLARKRSAAERGMSPAEPELNAFCETELTRVSAIVSFLPDTEIETDLLDRLFWNELGLKDRLRPVEMEIE